MNRGGVKLLGSEGEIMLRKVLEKGKSTEINCTGGGGIPEEEEVQKEERVLLWIHFICGEASLGLFINNVLYFLCAVEGKALY